METSGIVSDFYVTRNVVHGVFPGRILGAINAFVLQCREERLGHRIVIADSGAAGGVDTELGAKGGPNPAAAVVKITPADIETFKKEGKLG